MKKTSCIMSRDVPLQCTQTGDMQKLHPQFAVSSGCSGGGGLAAAEGWMFVEPTENDILCGRGRAPLKHPGNVKFFSAVREHIPTYVAAPRRTDKSVVVANLVERIQENGARFLKRDEKTARYYEISEEQARAKTGHAIRDLLRAKGETKGSKGAQSASAVSKKRKQESRSPPKKALQRPSSGPKKKTIRPIPASQVSSSARPSCGERMVLLGEKPRMDAPAHTSENSQTMGLPPAPMRLKQLCASDLVSFKGLSTVVGVEQKGRNSDENISNVLDQLSYFSALDVDDDELCSPNMFDLDLFPEFPDSVLSSLNPGSANREGSNFGEDKGWYAMKPAGPSFPQAFSSWDFSIDDPLNEDLPVSC